MMRRVRGCARLAVGLLALCVLGSCSSGSDDDSPGALGACNGFGRVGDGSSCTVALSCSKGKYELECAPDEGGTTVTSCRCLEAGSVGKIVDFDPAYCADQGSQVHGDWLEGLAVQADAVCGWNAQIL